MVDYSDTSLGHVTRHGAELDADLLHPIGRSKARQNNRSLDVAFLGFDLWTAYELSWLNSRGLPQMAIAELSVSCKSPNIVESKSVKLYLNSLNQATFDSWKTVQARLIKDFSAAIEFPVEINLYPIDTYNSQRPMSMPSGYCLDSHDVDIKQYTPDTQLLSVTDGAATTETLYSHLLRTNCPVTNQPDWGSIYVSYTGAPINKDGLLAYIVSYRQHQDFHEQCIEQVFQDIWHICQPSRLAVYGRYLRRGGIDINPFRSSYQVLPPSFREVRQ